MATPISNHFPTHRQYHLFIFCVLSFFFVLCCILLSAVYFALCIMCIPSVKKKMKVYKRKRACARTTESAAVLCFVPSKMEFSISSCVRGHHIYKITWTPTIGEVLTCERETSNTADRYAVAGTVSAACSLFLRRESTMECTITGARCYSADLPQGGLEVPCELRFKGNAHDVAKLKTLLAPAESSSNVLVGDAPVEQPRKKIKFDVITVEDVMCKGENLPAPWLSLT